MLARVEKKLISNYKPKDNKWKLHIGCGNHTLNDFINADLHPTSPHVFHLDATKRFPFSDQSFDFIFTEHMIEHISYKDGVNMLSECHRILRKGGRIRISTPDIFFLAKLYQKTRPLHQLYVKWSAETFLKDALPDDPTFVINNFFRDWGHQFIYSERTLRHSLKKCGFTEIKKCKLNESQSSEFIGLENRNRMPEGFLELETMTLEATKV
ncbi:hypothetical protein GCM10010872_18240 [Dyella flava]|nr:hypothetical protein GCM10010872_18240 [Dyella flava]